MIRISPADVGRRVSVRTRLPAGEDARFTDTVGWLRSWAEGRLRIQRRDGSLAELCQDDLVAGRVVGPPPPPRHR